ncbi:hypothetical protein D9619_006483 [Psilocybe cf. subviscida]|uniref:DUF6535 domain-containing protein n=1 Tax=Psilocybe cf. subviscida TaxID=2480587 RepID=A0A8H5EY06_9AGAR|nr:hypothetical protein D9619_006483 [Psilocybe cf. subviscida]
MSRPSQSEPRPKEPKPWQCGDSYRYPIPKPDGDPWELLLQPYLRKHNAQCEAWKNEIHYLLLFAGLFSVVMSIFVLHSTQSLQQNSTDATINMLATMLMSNVSAGGAQTPFNQTAAPFLFAPTRSHVRISILWFVSLILSLATLVAGVVVLQWIREYQLYADDISSKEAVSVYHMRVEAWKKWRVPQIISFLPLLLLCAVVLFFSGIIVYLFTLNRTVAIAVTVIIGITLFFLLITTLLPTIQCFILSLSEPSRKKDIPAQCPYKSTQSWIIYRLFAWIFRYTFALGWKMRYIPIAFFVRRKDRYSWTTFDSWWLSLRSTYAQFIHGVFTPSSDAVDTASPGYDESRIIVHAMQNHSETSKMVLAAYHCFQEVSQTALRASDAKELEDISSSLRKRNQLLHLLYWNGVQYGRLTGASNRLDASGVQKMHDENMMLFLWLPGDRTYSDVIARGLASHMLELQTRHLQYVMVQGSLEDSYFSDDREGLWMSRIYQQYRPTHQTARNFGSWQYALHRRISKDVAEASVEQYVMIFDAFVRKYASDAGQAWTLKDLQSNTHGRAILEDFLSITTIIQAHLFSSSESTYTRIFRETLIFISTVLEISWSYTEVHERHDFLFFSITYMLSRLLSYSETILQYIPADLLRSLARYESTVDKSSWEATFTGNYSIGNWATRLAEMEKTKTLDLHGSRKPLVQKSPSPGEQLLTALPTADNDKTPKSGSPHMPLIAPLSPLVLRSESDSMYVARSDEAVHNGTAKSLEIADSNARSRQTEEQMAAATEADNTLVNFDTTNSASRVVELLDENANAQRADSQAIVTSGQRDVQNSNSQNGGFFQSQALRQGQSEEMSRADTSNYFNQNTDSQAIITSGQRDVQNSNSQNDGFFQSQTLRQNQSEEMSRSDTSNYFNQNTDSQAIVTSGQRNVQTSDSQNDGFFQSQNSWQIRSGDVSRSDNSNEFNQQTNSQVIITSSQQDVQTSNSQNDSYFQSQNSRQIQSEETTRSDNFNYFNQQSQSQEQNFNNSERFDSSLTQRSDYNTTERTDTTFNNRRVDWQDNRFNSFTSSQYDTSNRNSAWMQQTFNRGESWSSRMLMDQSVRSSQAVDEFGGHENVDGNLFY